jgi:hypothetical protein
MKTLRRLAILAAVATFAAGAIGGPAVAATDHGSAGVSRQLNAHHDDDDDDDDDFCLVWFVCDDD